MVNEPSAQSGMSIAFATNNTLLPPSNRIIESETGWTLASNVSILMHLLGKSRNTSGVYMMRNRMIGQVLQSDTTTCSDK